LISRPALWACILFDRNGFARSCFCHFYIP
jgi:hypothetical protein